MNVLKKVVNFLFELGHLSYVPRSGWHKLGIKDPQSVAEHTARTAQIAFVLATLEGHKNPCHCATDALFHDITETRTMDMNRVSKGYNLTDHKHASFDQIAGMEKVSENIAYVWNEFEDGKTRASVIARDADILELMLTARDIEEAGYKDAKEFLNSGMKRLQTESGKKIGAELYFADPNAWWKEFQPSSKFAETVGL